MVIRINAALNHYLPFPTSSTVLLVSYGMTHGCLTSNVLGLPAYAERRLRLRNCSLSRMDYQ